ncbi:MAG: hypothetical protein IIW33_02910 [Oscillospiraceae bacterium]|nr:hypothetical protein [Oscillospiraceae bacterium]
MIFIKAFLKIALSLIVCAALSLSPVSALASSSGIAQSETDRNEAGRADVFEASISEIKTMLEKGYITSEQLCETYIERINKYDKAGVKLNSVISINTNAIAQAKQLDTERKAGHTRGILHGIPILVKDNIDVSGFPTSLGKTSAAKTVAETDAAAVAYLVGQGAIILGKTNMSTDDVATRYTYSNLIGETRNVYNTALSAGGSSGGSAVAVSANLAAAALGTDTNGSMTYPAALNGVVALRPTHALVDYSGIENVIKARDTVAPTAKTVADLALLLDVLTDSTEKMTYSKGLSKDYLKGKTVAVVKELSQYTYNSPNEFRKIDKEITEQFNKAISAIEAQGATVVKVSIPKLFTYYSTCRESNSNSANAKAALKAELKSLLETNGADAFIFPSYLSAPLKSGFNEYGNHNSADELYLNSGMYLPSLVGLPAITVPMGNHSSGAATGLEIVGLAGEDAKILNIAYSFESGSKLRVAPQKTPNLYKKVERPIEQEESTSSEAVSSEKTESKPQKNENTSPKGQYVAVGVIIASVLALCIFVMAFGSYKDKKKSLHKNRNF